MKTPKALKPVYRPDLLLKLADYLCKIDNQFDLDSWVGDENATHDFKKKLLKGKPTHATHKTCGTTACAMGHAVSIPELYKEGLRLVDVGSGWIVPRHKGLEGIEAAESLFGITERVAEDLFTPDGYEEDEVKDPKIVAKKIYEFVADPLNFAESI